MHLLSVAHLQSSLLGGFGLAPTQKRGDRGGDRGGFRGGRGGGGFRVSNYSEET